jgi:hypothetical protein
LSNVFPGCELVQLSSATLTQNQNT